MKIRSVPLLKYLLWLAASGIVLWPATAQSARMSSQQRQLFALVNAERAKAGLSSLQWDDSLADAARAHTQMMTRRGELSHQFSGEPALTERAGAAGAHFNSVAENVAYGRDVISLHEGFMKSPHHRANILAPESNAIGIAFVQRGGELYVTEDFAHLMENYSSDQFRKQVISSFERLRKSKGLQPIATSPDPRLDAAACTAKLDPHKIIRTLPGVTNLAMFTASQPGDLPSTMQQAAADKSLRRMKVGVCFKPGGKTGFSRYWVVAAFYPMP